MRLKLENKEDAFVKERKHKHRDEDEEDQKKDFKRPELPP